MSTRLGLRAGDRVRVRSAEEILATLDDGGSLDALPFMPEMLRFCGRVLRVGSRADKTCDTIADTTRSLRMLDAVHLEGVRCDGSAHGGCQARCLVFWKEAWLEPVREPDAVEAEDEAPSGPVGADVAAVIERATRASEARDSDGEEVYRCQATELQRATTPIEWWHPGQYVRALTSRNVGPLTFLATVARAAFNFVQRRRGGLPRPHVLPVLDGPTPVERLDLQPGELVRIRTQQEIEETLDRRQRNRGLYFDVEMLPFCGRTARVLDRVERIVDERTGRMLHFGSDCIMLEGVVCGGLLSHDRLFCPRAIHPYWREIWLERVGEGPAGAGPFE